MKDLELISTNDGSHTIFVPSLNETYHSRKGAISESRYVFIEKGLSFFHNKINKKNISVFEVGFGTGLNGVLSFEWHLKYQQQIFYHTIEPDPLPVDLIKQLNYPGLLNDKVLSETFFKMHNCAWDEITDITDGFQMFKQMVRLENLTGPSINIDLIFFDAFAPGKQPEIWDIENLQKLSQWMNSGGILVTYCAQGAFRRNLIQAGFEVEKLPGPLGKKEMIRAYKI